MLYYTVCFFIHPANCASQKSDEKLVFERTQYKTEHDAKPWLNPSKQWWKSTQTDRQIIVVLSSGIVVGKFLVMFSQKNLAKSLNVFPNSSAVPAVSDLCIRDPPDRGPMRRVEIRLLQVVIQQLRKPAAVVPNMNLAAWPVKAHIDSWNFPNQSIQKPIFSTFCNFKLIVGETTCVEWFLQPNCLGESFVENDLACRNSSKVYSPNAKAKGLESLQNNAVFPCCSMFTDLYWHRQICYMFASCLGYQLRSSWPSDKFRGSPTNQKMQAFQWQIPITTSRTPQGVFLDKKKCPKHKQFAGWCLDADNDGLT